jgi:DNA repair protein SbcC/Rad50
MQMIKIHKIFIKNFKGVRQKKVIDFSRASLTILDGPNGFGKTTIFDAIEICLRGRIERTVSYDYVTKKNADHKKPFYQNNKGEDVLLKLWLKDDEGGRDHIIAKFLAKDHDGKIGTGKAFRPDSWQIISTFYSSDTADFENNDEVRQLESVDQSFVDQLIFNQPDLSLVNLYPLFNYLQQEENIYFLKKDEEKKKNELDFLFQTQQDAQKLEKVGTFLRGVRSCKQDLITRLAELGEISTSDTDVAFKKLFPGLNLLFDLDGPFKDTSSQNLVATYERIRNELEEVITFKQKFNPDEYDRFKLRESLIAVRNREALSTAFVLHAFFGEPTFSRLNSLRKQIDSYNGWKTKLVDGTLTDEDLTSMNFDITVISNMRSLQLRRDTIEKQIGDLAKIIVDLNSSRSKVMSDFGNLDHSTDHATNCPLCNSEFQSMELLEAAVHTKTELLRSVNETQVALLEQVNNDLRTSMTDPILQHIEAFLAAPENRMDLGVFELVSQHRDYESVIERFNNLVDKNSLNLSQFRSNVEASMEEVTALSTNLIAEINNIIDELVLDDEKIAGRSWYKDLFNETPELFQATSLDDLTEKRNYLYKEYMATKFTSANILRRRLEVFERIEGETRGLEEILDKSIKKYKMEMVDKIKIPFYILSGKIIQNYQQGFGIFIDMNDRTNRVRFLTDNNSDHDVIHHLSSGQLAVVSIAFCLALNKVYNTANNFKFLAIDDPVQTLDDINVHSFIELMRHDFKNYQILISTHEENVADYMNYKFTKFGFVSARQRVQRLFY